MAILPAWHGTAQHSTAQRSAAQRIAAQHSICVRVPGHAHQDVVPLQEDSKRNTLVADSGMTAVAAAQTGVTNSRYCLKTRISDADLDVVLWQEDIRRNEFVAEYTGELINHREADRRGKAYDRDSNTYLFDLNDDWVIDAKHRGNKMRFANHRFGSNEYACHRDLLNVTSYGLLHARLQAPSS